MARRTSTGLPLEVVDRGGGGSDAASGRLATALARLDQAGVRVRPQLFAYQFLYELRPASDSGALPPG